MGKLIDEKVDVNFDDVHMDVHMLVVKSLYATENIFQGILIFIHIKKIF